MLKQPRRLPQRYRRPVTPQMRRVVQRRHVRHRQYAWQRWVRLFQRFQRRAGSLKRLALRFSAAAVGCMVLLCIGLALFSPLLQIQEIRVPRTDPRIDEERLKPVLLPFRHQHLFFLQAEHVQSAIEKSIPDIKSVSVSKEYPGTLLLTLELDPIAAKLSIENPGQEAGTGAVTGTGANAGLSDYLTDEGVYMAYMPSQVESASGLTLLTVVDWAVRPEAGKQLVDAELLTAMRDAEASLQTDFHLPVRSRTVFLRAREFHLKLPAYSLWFDLRSPLDEQLRRFRAFLTYVGAGNAKQYVDLRIQGTIVYK